jgi:TolA-binding protein
MPQEDQQLESHSMHTRALAVALLKSGKVSEAIETYSKYVSRYFEEGPGIARAR